MTARAAALLVASLLAAQAHSAEKADIHGFRLGMTEEQAAAQSKACDCDGMTFGYARDLPAPALKVIAYTFQSGTPPAEMIGQVSAQFGVKPVKADWKREIIDATNGRIEDVYLPLAGTAPRRVVGGIICRWKLHDAAELLLHLEKPGFKDQPATYKLILQTRRYDQAEAAARDQRRRAAEAKARKINPAPKF